MLKKFFRVTTVLVLVFLLSIFISSLAHASYLSDFIKRYGSPSSARSAKPTSKSTIITFNCKVTNKSTNKPVSLARVELSVLYGAGVRKAFGLTDKDGNATLTISYQAYLLLNKPCFLRVYSPGYATGAWQGSLGETQTVPISLKSPDQTPPVGTIKINNDAVYARSNYVTLNLNAKDPTDNNGSGITTRVSFSEDNKNWSNPEEWRSSSMSWKLFPGDGVRTVYVKFMDIVGNWSVPVFDSIILDATPPVINITYPPDKFLTNQKSITVKYTVDGEPKTLTYNRLRDGMSILQVAARDTAGNNTLAGVRVLVDTKPPVVVITSPKDNFLTNQKTITLNYTVDGAAKSEERALTEGPNTLTASAVDSAGNNGLASVKITLDTTAPAKPIVTDNGQETAFIDKLSINWVSSDLGSGIVEYQYKITQDSSDGLTVIDWTSVGLITGITKTGLTLSLGKIYYFSIKAKDAAGSWSEIGSSDGIKIISLSNASPQITSILPIDKSEFLSGATLVVQVIAVDPDNDTMEYQVSIGGTVKQSWSNLNTYSWTTGVSDAGAVSVVCEVRDSNGAIVSQGLTYSIINLSADEVLQKVANNYALINDQKANMSVSTILDLQPLGETEYYIYYFKKPKKEKIETYSASDRISKTDVTVIDGSTMYLVNPDTKEVQNVDLLAKSSIDSAQFNQMDVYYNLPEFLAGHTVTKNEGDSDLINYIIAIDAVPKTANSLYEKLELFIDYKKGLLVKSLLSKDGSLKEKMEVQESRVTPNGAWLPVKMVKTPMLTSGNMVNTLTYSDIQINVGLKDEDFDPAKQ